MSRRLSSVVASLQLSRSSVWAVALCAVAALSVTALRSTAVSSVSATPTPPVVGIVNLETLINGLTELKDRNDAVRSQGSEIQKRLDSKKKEIEGLEDELRAMAPKKDERKSPQEINEMVEKRLRLAELNANLDADFKGAQQRIELRKGAIIRDLYVKSLATIEAFAKKEGFDTVLLDDRSRNVPELTTNQEMSAVIEGRRILYANNSLDITERVRVSMENEWAAKGKK